MVTNILPEQNQVYHIKKHSVLEILRGRGGIQVDFRNYFDWKNKIIFLERGQYIRFLSDSFEIQRIEVENNDVLSHQEARVLFKHLISLGYVDADNYPEGQKPLSQAMISGRISEVIDISARQWYRQNPFQAKREEYRVLFDVKEIVDKYCKRHLRNRDLDNLIGTGVYDARTLFPKKVGVTIRQLLSRKRILESQKEIAFSNKSISEVAYAFGYRDPAYFNRVFRKQTGVPPGKFRDNFEYAGRDAFIQDLCKLIEAHHTRERSLQFYASKMHTSAKNLARRVRQELNISPGKLIRLQLIETAKSMLSEGEKIQEIAFRLNFEEANHFSTFFKRYTGVTPSAYQGKKYND